MPEPFGVASPALCCLEWISGVAFHAYELVEHSCLCFRETGHDGKRGDIYKYLVAGNVEIKLEWKEGEKEF